MNIEDAYEGDDFVRVKSEAGAKIEIKVDGKVLKTETATGNSDEIILYDVLEDGELLAGQNIEVTATLEGKLPRTLTMVVEY